jgi:hypothetical protein
VDHGGGRRSAGRLTLSSSNTKDPENTKGKPYVDLSFVSFVSFVFFVALACFPSRASAQIY